MKNPCSIWAHDTNQGLSIYTIFDNLTKFIWVKNYTKTYKSRKNNRNIRKIRMYTREDRTEKIHEKRGKKSAK